MCPLGSSPPLSGAGGESKACGFHRARSVLAPLAPVDSRHMEVFSRLQQLTPSGPSCPRVPPSLPCTSPSTQMHANRGRHLPDRLQLALGSPCPGLAARIAALVPRVCSCNPFRTLPELW